jgi:hypothetical protein
LHIGSAIPFPGCQVYLLEQVGWKKGQITGKRSWVSRQLRQIFLPAICHGDIAPLPVNGDADVDDLIAVILAWGPCR